ncbi:MAG: hypothetical protein QOH05_4421 [Acetobacteraceae bacterium]|jgi:sporulation protein YlmC with PRC-barrel domain|nr:hypothetical protein [Acetobacteraceae bacterium]
MIRVSAIILAAGLSIVAIPPVSAQQPAGRPEDPKVTVAAVRLDNGYRASRIIGAAVYNDQNQQVGTVSELFMSKQNQVAMVVVSVGSFLGIGGKLVSVPMDKLQIDDAYKVTMAGATKEELNKMPNVEYGS